MKLNISIRYIKKVAKSLKIDINGLKIEAKKENCIITNIKDIILLFQAFYIYIQILVFFSAPKNKLQL